MTAPQRGWLLRLDQHGAKQWEGSYGAFCSDVITLNDDGLLVVGTIENDGMILRLNARGERVWDRRFQGNGTDFLVTITSIPGDVFWIGGHSSSLPGLDKTSASYGGADGLVIAIDSEGNVLWDKTFGGTQTDYLSYIQPANGGGVIVSGGSYSSDGTRATPAFGNADVWVLRLDPLGNVTWEQSFGTSDWDTSAGACQLPDGGFAFLAITGPATNGNKGTTSFGGDDVWLIRTDRNGRTIWETAFGGDSHDDASAIALMPDGGLMIGAASSSGTSGNKSVTGYGGTDYWIVKLAADAICVSPKLRPLFQTKETIEQRGFEFYFLGSDTLPYVMEFSTNSVWWTPFQTNIGTGQEILLRDPDASRSPHRIYRARLLLD